MRTVALAVALAFAVVLAASAQPHPGPYRLDGRGECHAANGQVVATSLCKRRAAGAVRDGLLTIAAVRPTGST